MTTLYKPVPIETVEQAEALPEGTIITHAEYHPQEKFAGLWGRDRNTNRQLAQQVGWTALVPIEAEEETARPMKHPASCLSFGPDDELPEWLFDGPPRTRLVTPWEEA